MPRRAVHPEFAIAQAQNDAIVAQNLWITDRPPESCSRALAGSRVPKKKMPAGCRVQQSAAMDLHPQPVARKIICDEQLIGGIFERPVCFWKHSSVQRQLRGSKIRGAQLLIRIRADRRTGEIEDEIPILSIQLPNRSRIKTLLTGRIDHRSPLKPDFQVRWTGFDHEFFEIGTET